MRAHVHRTDPYPFPHLAARRNAASHRRQSDRCFIATSATRSFFTYDRGGFRRMIVHPSASAIPTVRAHNASSGSFAAFAAVCYPAYPAAITATPYPTTSQARPHRP